MTDAGLFGIALAIYFGLKAISDAVRNRKIEVTVPSSIEWNVRLVEAEREPRP